MFQFTFHRADDEAAERVTVIADSRDVLKWERAGRDRSVTELLAKPNMDHCYPLAWIAAKRQGLLDCTLQAFEAEYLLVFGREPAPDPTQPAR